jgi:penicillin V acylase-like amidase (Ntn superfamily)
VAGKKVVHHGRDYRVMTNDPTYDEQLVLLKAVDLSHPSSNMPLPGNVNPRDRFQRAVYYSALLPKPTSVAQAVAGVMAIARNASVPFGAPYQGFGVYNTEYRTVVDSSHRLYFFELTTNPSTVWIDLGKLATSRGAPARTLDPADWRLAGNVTAKLKAAKAPF